MTKPEQQSIVGGPGGSPAGNPAGAAAGAQPVRPSIGMLVRRWTVNLMTSMTRRYEERLVDHYRLSYDPRPDDIFVVSYPKSGTTWMQMIMYQLSSDGDMGLPHISVKVPFLENDLMKFGVGMENMVPRRIFKTHLSCDRILKGPGKYVYVMRNGMSVAYSYYHHYRLYEGFPGSFDDFFKRYMAGHVAYGTWFDHVDGWLTNKEGLDVLVVTYEDLHADFEATLRKIAAFCNLELRESEVPRIVERCSFAFMSQYQEKFDLSRGRMSMLRSALVGRVAQTGGQELRLGAAERRAFAERFERVLGGLGLERCALEEPLSGAAPEAASAAPAAPNATSENGLPLGRRLRLRLNDASMSFADRTRRRLSRSAQSKLLHAIRARQTSRPDDLWIVSYPGSGAEWVQMVVHQLAGGKETSFDAISGFQPIFERAFLERPRRFAELPGPRIVASKLPYHEVLHGQGRYLYVVRNGFEVAVQGYRQMVVYGGFQGTFAAFFERFLRGPEEYGSWFDHVGGWVRNAQGLNVLVVEHGSLTTDFDATVEKIVRFCGHEPGVGVMAKIRDRCRAELMRAFEDRLDWTKAPAPSPAVAVKGHVREGKTDGWKSALSDAQKQAYAARFERTFAGRGLDRYRPDAAG